MTNTFISQGIDHSTIYSLTTCTLSMKEKQMCQNQYTAETNWSEIKEAYDQ